ncbi:MAG: type II secretion system protein [Candidatus Pacebacteria bacterium]|nr:type II secretion system protein [Candidatus Paceibacterota bacterium]
MIKNKKGFTLIELLVYIGIFSILAAGIFSFVIWVVQSNHKTMVSREVLDNARRAMEIITYQIRESENVYSSTSVFEISPGQLSLKTKKYLPSGEEESYIDFYICENKLCLKEEEQAPIPFTSDRVKIDKLIFNKVGENSIQIYLKVDYLAPNNKSEYQGSADATSTVNIRY